MSKQKPACQVTASLRGLKHSLLLVNMVNVAPHHFQLPTILSSTKSPIKANMPRKASSFLAKTAVEFGSRTTVHGVGYVADSQFPHSIRILWLGVTVLCLCLAGYLSHK